VTKKVRVKRNIMGQMKMSASLKVFLLRDMKLL
jgi:hypothetical protein